MMYLDIVAMNSVCNATDCSMRGQANREVVDPIRSRMGRRSPPFDPDRIPADLED